MSLEIKQRPYIDITPNVMSVSQLLIKQDDGSIVFGDPYTPHGNYGDDVGIDEWVEFKQGQWGMTGYGKGEGANLFRQGSGNYGDNAGDAPSPFDDSPHSNYTDDLGIDDWGHKFSKQTKTREIQVFREQWKGIDINKPKSKQDGELTSGYSDDLGFDDWVKPPLKKLEDSGDSIFGDGDYGNYGDDLGIDDWIKFQQGKWGMTGFGKGGGANLFRQGSGNYGDNAGDTTSPFAETSPHSNYGDNVGIDEWGHKFSKQSKIKERQVFREQWKGIDKPKPVKNGYIGQVSQMKGSMMVGQSNLTSNISVPKTSVLAKVNQKGSQSPLDDEIYPDYGDDVGIDSW